MDGWMDGGIEWERERVNVDEDGLSLLMLPVDEVLILIRCFSLRMLYRMWFGCKAKARKGESQSRCDPIV